MQHLSLAHKSRGNCQVYHADAQIVQRLHLRYQHLRAAAELGLVDEHGSDKVDFAFPITGGSSGRGWRAFQVRKCSELRRQLLRLFIGIGRDDVATKENLVLSRLPSMPGGLCFVVRNHLRNIRQGSE